MDLRDRINNRLDSLEARLQKGDHLAGAESQAEMTALVANLAKFFPILGDDERDLVISARMAIQEKLPWR